MPNPKRRHSKTRTAKRRTHDTLKAVPTGTCPQCQETKADGALTEWAWLTPLPLDRDTVVAVATRGGRARWREENEGFNTQKNSGLNREARHHGRIPAPRRPLSAPPAHQAMTEPVPAGKSNSEKSVLSA